MLMSSHFFRRYNFEVRIKGIQFTFRCLEVEAFEVVGDGTSVGTFRESHSLFFADNGHDVPLAFISEEVIQPNSEHHCNTQESG